MWEELKKYVEFLHPFQVATDTVQSDRATLYDVQQCWSMLRAHVAAHPISVAAVKHLRRRWRDQINGDAAIATALVALKKKRTELGVTAEHLASAQRFLIEFGVKYIIAYSLSPLSASQLKGQLLIQLGEMLDRRGSFSDLDDILTAIAAADSKWNPLNVWALRSNELALVAKALLSLPASEAAVERTFSAQGLVHTKLRNRLLDAAVQTEMFVAFNRQRSEQYVRKRIRPAVTVHGFMSDTDSDTEVEEDSAAEEESKSAAESDDDDNEAPPAAAAAAQAESAAAAAPRPAAPAPLRSRSSVIASNEHFLDEYVRRHPDCLRWRWNDDKINALEAAASEYSKETGIATVGVNDLQKALKKRGLSAAASTSS